MEDLQPRLAASIDAALFSTATYGAIAVANAHASTATTPELLLGEIYDAQVEVGTAVKGAPASHAIMDIATWRYLYGHMTNVHPLVGNTLGVGQLGNPAYVADVRGVLPNGLAVVVDANIPLDGANHQVLVVPNSEALLFESGQVFARAENPSALSVTFALYAYVAWEFRRIANAFQIVDAVTLAAEA